ncbi:MAG: membrane protein insertase YidC [Gammaproteobacteria bacterium]
MENRRFILIALLGVVLFFMYQAWQRDYASTGPVQATAPAAAPTASAVTGEDEAPVARLPGSVAAAEAAPDSSGERIRVETDRLVAEISLLGGELRRLDLKDYPVSKDQPDQPLALLDDRNGRLFVLQSGLAGTQDALVTHKTAFSAEAGSYRLAEGADTLSVTLRATDPRGFQVDKTYTFKRDSYEIELAHTLRNTGTEPLVASPYARFVRNVFKAGDEPPFVATFMGVGFYEQKDGGGYRFRKTSLDDLDDEPFERTQTGGWIGLLQHYFVTAILPAAEDENRFAARPSAGQGYLAQYVGPAQAVAPGAEQRFVTPVFAGPKLQDVLGDLAPGLELTVDYGILTPISEPLFWLLAKFYLLTGNWGFAIILLTLAVKGLMYKLSEAQYRSMAKMKKFAPRIQDIKERFGDDREKLQKAMMDLYKKEGFNPLAGCWPLLVQFPVFIALYWVLLESVELRQAPFLLWLNDLSSPDPYFVLPVLFGISMFAQQKLSGQQMMDPMQQRIMNIMPIMLTAFFAFFQSGLVLYWLVSNLVGISQQWYITRKLENEAQAPVRVKR